MRPAGALGFTVLIVVVFAAIFQTDSLATDASSLGGGLDAIFARVPLLLLVLLLGSMALALVAALGLAFRRR